MMPLDLIGLIFFYTCFVVAFVVAILGNTAKTDRGYNNAQTTAVGLLILGLLVAAVTAIYVSFIN